MVMKVRVWMLGVTLLSGWSAAQSDAVQTEPTQASPAQASIAQAPGAQVAGPKTPTDSLISALKKSWQAEARGNAVLELVFPPNGAPLRNASRLPRLEVNLPLIRRNFTVTAQAASLAGRPVRRFELVPRNIQAARWRVWVDSKWNVPLAYQERMPDGHLARRAELVTVNAALTRLDRAPTVQNPATQNPATQNPATQKPSPALKKALISALPGLKLPAGFEPLSVQTREFHAPGNTLGEPINEVLLSDGLNVLTLIFAPRSVKAANGVAVRKLGGQWVWLVGNLPQELLEGTLAGIRRLNVQAVADMTGTFAGPAASEQ
jgi:hypothetical protein